MQYSTGQIYEGWWFMGARDGMGRLLCPARDEAYLGSWVQGERDGLGCQFYYGGSLYIGRWSKDMR